MSYELLFLPSAKKEWDHLSSAIALRFKKKLAERLTCPRVPKDRLRNFPDCYKIKLRSDGYRLVYQVHDKMIVLVVVSVGKRDKNAAYNVVSERLLK